MINGTHKNLTRIPQQTGTLARPGGLYPPPFSKNKLENNFWKKKKRFHKHGIFFNRFNERWRELQNQYRSSYWTLRHQKYVELNGLQNQNVHDTVAIQIVKPALKKFAKPKSLRNHEVCKPQSSRNHHTHLPRHNITFCDKHIHLLWPILTLRANFCCKHIRLHGK